MKSRLSILIVTLFVGMALAGCATNDDTTPTGTTEPTNPTDPTEPTEPTVPVVTDKTYVHQTIGEPESLDPAYDYETAGGTVLQQVYETLVFYNGPSADILVPRLAAEMPTLSDDGLTYTFKIREGVKFHNGDTLDAADVKFSLDRIVLMNDPDGPAWIYGPLKGADTYMASDGTAADRAAYLAEGALTVVDDMTVTMTLSMVDPSFLSRLAYQGASVVSMDGVCANAPSNFVDCLPPPGETRHPWMDEHEVGTGPYLVESWVRDQTITLLRFDDYWGNEPALKRVIIQKVEDFNARLLSLQSGAANSIYVPVDHAADVVGLSGVEIVESPSWTVSFLGLNQEWCHGPDDEGYASCSSQYAAYAPKGKDGTVDPLFFSDPKMRELMVLAFDYDTYIDEILEGHGKRLNGPLPEGIFGWDSTIPYPEQDLDGAKAALAASNHPDGFELTIAYNSGNTVREKTAQLFKQTLESLSDGITVTVSALDFSSAYLPATRAAAVPVFYLGWAPDYAFPDNYVVTFAHSEKGIYSKRIEYKNDALDTLLNDLGSETDPAKLEKGYSDAVKLLNADNAFVWLGQLADYHVHRDNVEGYYYNPMYSGNPGIGDYAALSLS